MDPAKDLTGTEGVVAQPDADGDRIPFGVSGFEPHRSTAVPPMAGRISADVRYRCVPCRATATARWVPVVAPLRHTSLPTGGHSNATRLRGQRGTRW